MIRGQALSQRLLLIPVLAVVIWLGGCATSEVQPEESILSSASLEPDKTGGDHANDSPALKMDVFL